MTLEYNTKGAAYHWKTELYKRLNLPVYEGVEKLLEKQNRQRKKALDDMKTEEAKRRRVERKSLRVKEGQRRILWSKQHRHDTYGEVDELFPEEKATAGTAKTCKKCGSDTHALPTHRLCPYNKKRHHTFDGEGTKEPDTDSEIVSIGDDVSMESDCDYDEYPHPDELYVDMREDNLISGCNCGACGRAHNRECPLNPRNKHTESFSIGDKHTESPNTEKKHSQRKQQPKPPSQPSKSREKRVSQFFSQATM